MIPRYNLVPKLIYFNTKKNIIQNDMLIFFMQEMLVCVTLEDSQVVSTGELSGTKLWGIHQIRNHNWAHISTQTQACVINQRRCAIVAAEREIQLYIILYLKPNKSVLMLK
jgi:hypothetical protein